MRKSHVGEYTTSRIIDVLRSGHATFGGSADAQYKGGSHVGKLDPLMTVSAMAAVTKSVSFGITASTSYIRE